MCVTAIMELCTSSHGGRGSETEVLLSEPEESVTCVSGMCGREVGPEATLSSEPRYSCTSPTFWPPTAALGYSIPSLTSIYNHLTSQQLPQLPVDTNLGKTSLWRLETLPKHQCDTNL